jgi:hypothetical protein
MRTFSMAAGAEARPGSEVSAPFRKKGATPKTDFFKLRASIAFFAET